MSEIKWWFAFRQWVPQPSGTGIAVGPFDSYRKAIEERQRTKAWDCDVSEPFPSGSKEEAEQRACRTWSAPRA